MFEKKVHATPEIGLTPLIDIVFILLIFVVLAANFDRIKGVKVKFPKATSNQVLKPTKSLVVSISETGTYFVQEQAVPSDQLFQKLQSLKTKYKALILRADQKVPLQKAITVLDIAKKMGFESVSIATQQASK